jgi:hypothetical protein
MTRDYNIRWTWLRIMYIYTIVGAGGFGLGILLFPDVLKSLLGWPTQDPIVLGIFGSVGVAFGLLSILGLRSPLKFVPILLLELCYKTIWFVAVILPLLITGQCPLYAIFYKVVFATYIIGDLIAIPFPYVFAKEGPAA